VTALLVLLVAAASRNRSKTQGLGQQE